MSFWKPGEEYPDGLDEETVKLEGDMPMNRMGKELTKTKVQLSERMKNMSFMVRSEEEKERQRKEVAAMKELKSYMWSYRNITATESLNFSQHPCCGPVINTVEEEECKRFSFGGFNPKVDEIMKERKNHRSMKHSVKDIPEEDVMETLNRYSTLRGNRKPVRRGVKRNRE